jgi:hypothetical protein
MDGDDELENAAAEGRRLVEALDALRAWLLLEDAYVRGGVPDEVLHFIHDHISRLLGPQAHTVAGDILRTHVEAGGDLADLACDRSALLNLLAAIEGKQRPALTHSWTAHAPLGGQAMSSEQTSTAQDVEDGGSKP